jgi:hypothetical protein
MLLARQFSEDTFKNELPGKHQRPSSHHFSVGYKAGKGQAPVPRRRRIMLTVLIDIVPFGEEVHRKNLLELRIGNDMSSNDPRIGNYKVRARDERGQTVEYAIHGFRREAGAHMLAMRCLEGYEQNRPK